MKVCSSCERELPIDSFYKNRGKPASRCKKCRTPIQKQWYLNNRERLLKASSQWHKQNKRRRLATELRHFYDLKIEKYDEELEKQGGVCAICKKPPVHGKRLVIDHNHKTDQLRGLLCNSCNLGIAHFKEDISVFENAARYLNGGQSTPSANR